jgi:hypothetical protein
MPRSYTSLNRIKNLTAFQESGIPENFLDWDLPRLGISSAEDFLGLLRAERGAFAEETGASMAALEELEREVFTELIPVEQRHRFEEYPAQPEIFGAASVVERGRPEVAAGGLDQLVVAAELAVPAALPSAVSLLDGCMPEARHQGRRPTCTVFAAIGVLEYLLCRFDGRRVNLSEQYLYWLLSQNGALDFEGRALLGDVFEIARTAGVCQEQLWPYAGDNRPGDLTHGNPPDPNAAQTDAALHRFDTVLPVSNPKDIGTIREILGSDHPVAVTVPLFPSFSQEPFFSEGRLVLPFLMTTPSDHHSMVLVGYRAALQDPGGEVFLVRNSLGPDWGSASGLRPGFGTIPVNYVESLAEEAWTAKL